jgi:hypothetical protein
VAGRKAAEVDLAKAVVMNFRCEIGGREGIKKRRPNVRTIGPMAIRGSECVLPGLLMSNMCLRLAASVFREKILQFRGIEFSPYFAALKAGS